MVTAIAVLGMSIASAGAPLPLQGQPMAGDASRVERLLRPAIRLAGRPDTAFSLVARMRDLHVPGVSLAIIEENRVVYARGFGVTEFGGTTPVDTTTLFLAGSISKPVFASGALALVEQGKLSLDTDVNATLRSWRLPDSRFTEREKVTLRRLLTHTAGLTVWGFPGYAIDSPVPTIPQLLDGARPANTPAVRSDTTPGASWLYSGGGITIAQLMTSDVTGESFPALMRRLVLAPSGMTRSTYENPLPRARWHEAASGHERVDTPVRGRFHVYPEMAAAGLWTTAPDLARWAATLARAVNGEAVGPISPAMAQQMVSKQAQQQAPYGTGHWGLGVAVAGDGDSLSFSHGGRDEGFVAQVTMWPRLGRGIVILTNGVSGILLAEIMRGYAEAFGLPTPPRPVVTVAAVAPGTLDEVAGAYRLVLGKDSLRIDVRAERDRLVLRDPVGGRDMTLLPTSDSTFVDRDAATPFRVERDGASVRALLMGVGPAQRRLARQ